MLCSNDSKVVCIFFCFVLRGANKIPDGGVLVAAGV